MVEMTLEQARNTYWLRTFHKPMGELFDCGYLNARRLNWGVNNAYDPAIKSACSVLLKQKQVLSKTSIEKGKIPKNIEEARAVIWPFSKRTGKIGRAMGELVDNRDITKYDLAYALEKAWDEQVRSASRIILCSQLGLENEKVCEPKGSLKVTSNRSYMESQIERLSFWQGGFWGAVLAVCAVLFIADMIYMYMTGAIPVLIDFVIKTKFLGVLFIVVVIAISFFVGNFILKHSIERKFDEYDLQISNHKKGRLGEDKVVDIMRETLDGSCHAFRNLVLPNNKGDIDIVLVSPQGVFVFEVKAYSGKYEVCGDDWFYFEGKKRKKLHDNPTLQVRKNAARLAEFLDADFNRNNERKWVCPIVVMANADVSCCVKNSSVPVWFIQYLADELGNFPEKNILSERTQKEICEKLEKLYNV